MVLVLTPLLVFVTSLVVSGLLLRRYLPRPGAALGVSCVRCGTPAAAMAPDSFVCPGCGHDVREAGLAPARGKSPTKPLWTVILYTLAVLIAALITTDVAVQAAPRVQGSSSQAMFAAPQSRAYAGVSVTAAASGRQQAPQDWEWDVLGELLALDGRATLLEVEGPPLRWRVIADDGRIIEQGQSLDEDAVLGWYRAAGIDTDNSRVQTEASAVLARVQDLSQGPRASPRQLRAGVGAGFDSVSTGSSSGGGRPPAWVAPAVSAGWAALWVLGVWAILRPRRRRVEEPEAPGVPAAEPLEGVTP
jgi:hypothetical protein